MSGDVIGVYVRGCNGGVIGVVIEGEMWMCCE